MYCISLITLQGLPAAIAFAGIFLVTTLLAPIRAFSPIDTPLRTIQLIPSHTLSPIITSFGSPVRESSVCQSESMY